MPCIRFPSRLELTLGRAGPVSPFAAVAAAPHWRGYIVCLRSGVGALCFPPSRPSACSLPWRLCLAVTNIELLMVALAGKNSSLIGMGLCVYCGATRASVAVAGALFGRSQNVRGNGHHVV
eukprot:6465793-Amphidinium_carterae.1